MYSIKKIVTKLVKNKNPFHLLTVNFLSIVLSHKIHEWHDLCTQCRSQDVHVYCAFMERDSSLDLIRCPIFKNKKTTDDKKIHRVYIVIMNFEKNIMHLTPKTRAFI